MSADALEQITQRIILASSSPRRKEILEKMGVSFEIIPGNYDEDMSLPISPFELAKHLAIGKAEAVAQKFPDAVVIGADTIVVLDGKVFGKPHTKEVARKMLQGLSGKVHQVITGLAIIHVAERKIVNEAMATSVVFKILSDQQIEEYVNTGEPLDKAGAYAIQGVGGSLVEKIEGDYWNLVGLPANLLTEHLKNFGVFADPL